MLTDFVMENWRGMNLVTNLDSQKLMVIEMVMNSVTN